jgi:hypothetical protein
MAKKKPLQALLGSHQISVSGQGGYQIEYGSEFFSGQMYSGRWSLSMTRL